jgi:hypothetical protein
MWTYLLLVFIFIILCLICGWLSRIYKLLVEVFEEEEESDLPENNLVEFVWEDENGNGIYKIK